MSDQIDRTFLLEAASSHAHPKAPDAKTREMARRIAAILLLEPELNANYERSKSVCYTWKGIDKE